MQFQYRGPGNGNILCYIITGIAAVEQSSFTIKILMRDFQTMKATGKVAEGQNIRQLKA